jgi:hypothetical protein
MITHTRILLAALAGAVIALATVYGAPALADYIGEDVGFGDTGGGLTQATADTLYLGISDAATEYLGLGGGTLTGGIVIDGASLDVTTASGQDLTLGAAGAADVSMTAAAGVVTGDGTNPIVFGKAGASVYSLNGDDVIFGDKFEGKNGGYVDGAPLDICSGTCPTFTTAAAAGVLRVEGAAEFDGAVIHDGGATFKGGSVYNSTNSGLYVGTATNNLFALFDTVQTPDNLWTGLGTESRRWVIGEWVDYGVDCSYAQATDPTVMVRSSTGCGTAAGKLEWLSISASAASANIGSGHGPVAIGTTSGFLPAKVTADPCVGATAAAFPPGTVFVNSTSWKFCMCDGTSADLNVADGSACF